MITNLKKIEIGEEILIGSKIYIIHLGYDDELSIIESGSIGEDEDDTEF